ncbi:MAG: rod shape-determining protein MreC [Patescibacteria group bacterium]
MLEFLTSRKLLFVFVIILILTWVMFFTADNRDRETSAESFLRTAVAPVERIFDTVTDTTRSVLRTVSELHRLTAENRRLGEEIDRVAMENQTLRGYQLENTRLRAALELRQRLLHRLIAAEVIARSTANWYSRLTINLGGADGIKKDMGVIAAGGVVGRIYEVRSHTADVLLLTDSASQIGGMIERTGAHVLVRGQGGRRGLCRVLPYRDTGFRPGDLVVTWEESEYFPPGLVIGKIVRAVKGQGGVPLSGDLRPAVDPSTVDVLFVIGGIARETAP